MAFVLLFQSGAAVLALSAEQSQIFHSGISYYSHAKLEPREPSGNVGGATGSLAGCDNAQKIWNFFTQDPPKGKGLPAAVAAGFLGNMQEEAHFEPRLVEYGWPNSRGEISKAGQPSSLDDDVPPDQNAKGQPGYGIIQWTSPGRKQGLRDLASSRGVKAGTMEVQMDYLWQELNGAYKNSTLIPLTSDPGITPRAASEIITRNYEIPSGMEAAVARRQQHAQHWFNVFSTGTYTCGSPGANTPPQ